MKWLFGGLAIVVIMAIGLSVYLQPNSLALCPFNQGKPTTRDGCDPAEAIVVVSGGDTPARTEKAIDLFKHDWAPLIIFSGAAEDKTGPSNAAAMRQHAINQGVPAQAILMEEGSENTTENAVKTNDLLAVKDINDIILVTSGYHQRRASLEFRAATKDHGVEIRSAPVYDRDWHWYWWATPRGWGLALGEFGRIIVFYMGGGMAL